MHIRESASLVTGGSRGLGRALGVALGAAGSRVVLVARHTTALDDAVAAVRDVGGSAWGIAADVGDQHAIYAIAGEAAALAGPIDILINNASALGPTPLRLLLDTECEDLERVLQVNLVGPFRLTKVIGGAMALRGRGVVVNISSDAAVEAYAHWGAYGTAKAALDHLTRIWAAEMSDADVRLFAVDPGEMNTGMHADAMPEADPATLTDPAEVAARIVDMIADPTAAPTGSRLVAARWRHAA
jgi:NAD(P)-dependent dehydrogenase (short-subunit alcohol dehydrogenase family)